MEKFVDIFSKKYNLNSKDAASLLALMEPVTYRRGEMLVREGELNTSFHLIGQGIWRGYYLRNGVDVSIWFATTGESLFSTRGYMGGRPSGTSIEAMSDSLLYRIGRQELEALYREKIAEMERKIAYDNHVLARMSASARTLQTAQEQLMRPVRLSLGRVYLLEYPSVPDMWARVEREPLLKRLFGALPLTAYTTLIGREALDGAPPRMTKGILFHENDAEVLGFETDAFRCIDATCAVGCLFRLENGGFDAGELLEHLFAYMSEHRLRASDDLFTQQLVSYVDENSNAIHYARMIVPVGPEKSPA